jgi:hypothetical protein
MVLIFGPFVAVFPPSDSSIVLGGSSPAPIELGIAFRPFGGRSSSSASRTDLAPLQMTVSTLNNANFCAPSHEARFRRRPERRLGIDRLQWRSPISPKLIAPQAGNHPEISSDSAKRPVAVVFSWSTNSGHAKRLPCEAYRDYLRSRGERRVVEIRRNLEC